MSTSSRIFFGLALASLVLTLVVLVVPDQRWLGRAPTSAESLEWLSGAATSPAFLGSFAAGAALVLLSRRKGEQHERVRAPAALAPAIAGLSKARQLADLRLELAGPGLGLDGSAITEKLVQAAVRLGASDLHLQPGRDDCEVLLRVDGTLEPLTTLTVPQRKAVLNRLKVLGNLTHHVSHKPQDGQFSLETPDGKAEVRVSMLPTQHAEKAVLRLAGLKNAGPSFDELALPASVRAQLASLLERPQGLIYFAGPTGSGKTTSIYASIAHLQATRGGLAQIATIEDPIEFSLDGVAQTQVNRNAGLDFASGLRALLRQDPNVLVVGEIRDVETAQVATQAALTGHLLLTTVHAESAVGVFTRLLEMGVESSVLASVSLASFSQRLLRRLCPHCRVRHEPTPEHAQRLASWGALPTGYSIAPGCEECGGTGVMGRTSVFEVLVVSDAVRDALKASPSIQQLAALALTQGLVPLRESALVRARQGEVSLAEVFRVIA